MQNLGCSLPVKGMSVEYMRLSALFMRQRRTELNKAPKWFKQAICAADARKKCIYRSARQQ